MKYINNNNNEDDDDNAPISIVHNKLSSVVLTAYQTDMSLVFRHRMNVS